MSSESRVKMKKLPDKAELISLIEQGYSQKGIAKRYKVTISAVSQKLNYFPDAIIITKKCKSNHPEKMLKCERDEHQNGVHLADCKGILCQWE